MVQKIKNGALLKIMWLCKWDNMGRNPGIFGFLTFLFFIINIVLFLFNTSVYYKAATVPKPGRVFR